MPSRRALTEAAGWHAARRNRRRGGGSRHAAMCSWRISAPASSTSMTRLGRFLTQFGEGSLLAAGVAVDEATGLVYVADSFENAVLVFKPDGSAAMSRSANGPGEALAGRGIRGSDGGRGRQLERPVGRRCVRGGWRKTRSFGGRRSTSSSRSPQARRRLGRRLVRVLSKGKMEEPNGVAVDAASGQVYVADSVKGAVYEFSATGAFEGKLNGSSSPHRLVLGKEEEEGNVSAVAVDPVSRRSAGGRGRTRRRRASSTQAGEWVGLDPEHPGRRRSANRTGVAVGGSGRRLCRRRRRWRGSTSTAPASWCPDATTEKASKLTRTTAILNGTLNGQGKAGHYFFQWGTTPALGSSTTPGGVRRRRKNRSTATLERTARRAPPTSSAWSPKTKTAPATGSTREFTTPPAVEGLSTGPGHEPAARKRDADGLALARTASTPTTTSSGAPPRPTGNTSPEPPGHRRRRRQRRRHSRNRPRRASTPNTIYHYRLVAEQQLRHDLRRRPEVHDLRARRGSRASPSPAIGHEDSDAQRRSQPG